MGVLGLTPFLQKTCPQLIHKLPNRLRDLSGKKLVLDGTLITQRLHYAPSNQPFRHVLGWYHLAREMNENGVLAFCIFDGQRRSQAKSEELGRRRETRRLDMSRGTLELSRIKRLQKLRSVIHGICALDERGSNTVAGLLQTLKLGDSGAVGAAGGLSRVGERLRVFRDEASLPEDQEGDDERLLTPENYMSPLPSTPIVEYPQDSEFMVSELQDSEHTTPSLDDIASTLVSSYRDFRSSISKVVSLPLLDRPNETPSAVVPMEEQSQEDLVLSRTQCELTLEEGRVWDELTRVFTPSVQQSALDQPILRAAEDRLDALTSRSEMVADSYQRRMCVPTRSTYVESMEILEAMGVPCYEIEGTHEGEALASSLVHQGLADYVVSEDSDVLVYEAPLIRNISNRSDPLVLIHGSDIRTVLELSRDAYVDFAILLGTDFSQRIKNVGPSRAYKFIKEYGNIEGVVESQTKYLPKVPRTEYLAQVDSARAIFHTLPPIPDRLRVAHPEVNQAKVAVIMERCGLGKALMMGLHWDHEAALAGNYFGDNPSMVLS